MKTGSGRLIVAGGALAVVLSFAPNCAAQCGGMGRGKAVHSSWLAPSGGIRLLAAAFRNADGEEWRDGKPSIIGIWHVKFVSEGSKGIPDGTEVDAGYSQWHSDGTEILNSGGHQYDEKLNMLAHVVGKITGTRIEVDTAAQSIF